MAKGFGIAGLVLAIISVFVWYGFNFAAVWLAMLCCTVAALNGERTYTIAAILIAAAGLLVLSPVTVAAIASATSQGDHVLMFIAFLPYAFPIAAMVINSTRNPKTKTIDVAAPAGQPAPVAVAAQPYRTGTLIGVVVAAALIIAVVIVLLLAVGGYFWFTSHPVAG